MPDDLAIHGFVLVGGKSRRMGRDKALIEFRGKQLIQRVAEVLSPFVQQVTLLGPAERYASFGLPIIEDRWPGQGPLAAICTALLWSRADWNVFLACDLPLVSQQFVQFLVQRLRTTHADAVAPRTADGWQPLAAAYHARCRAAFQRAFEGGERSVINTFEAICAEAITPDQMAAAGLSVTELANINTPEDWRLLITATHGKGTANPSGA